MKYIAYTTKGLEFFSEKEIIELASDAQVVEMGDKRVIFESNVSFYELEKLRTVDDIGLLIAAEEVQTASDVKHHVLKQDFKHIRNLINAFRTTDDTFSLTLGVVSSGISTDIIKEELIQSITSTYGWQYTALIHNNFDIRIFIHKQKLYVSVRLTKESLHHRSYKTQSREGSLRPTIAAAMVKLATQNKNNAKIIDTFCGSGTILSEAALMKHQINGSDINPEAVSISKSNLSNIGTNSDSLRQYDGQNTKWPSNTYDCAISNLPWDKQIKVASITTLYTQTVQEWKRLLKPEGTLCALVTKPELLVKICKKEFPKKSIQTFKIGLLGQTPTIILVKSDILEK